TRFSRDWSSDVCSSDLNDLRYRRAELQMKVVNELYSLSAEAEVAKSDAEKANEDVGFLDSAWDDFKGSVINQVVEYQNRVTINRSEERRVGKRGVGRGH